MYRPSRLPPFILKQAVGTWLGPWALSLQVPRKEESCASPPAASLPAAPLSVLASTVALRKTETSHHLSLDKASVPPEIFQKSCQLAEFPQKPPHGDLPPKPTELAPKPQIGDLPPKPGELPPKPQLGDLPPKPQLSDLPPKPQMKDLPPKPQLGDLLAKPQVGDVSPKAQQPSEVAQKPHPVDLSPSVPARDAIQKQASEDSNDLMPTLPETPVPLPRKINTVGRRGGSGSPRLARDQALWGVEPSGWAPRLWAPSDRPWDLPSLPAVSACLWPRTSLSLSILVYSKELTLAELTGHKCRDT